MKKKNIEDFIITEGRYKGKLDQKALQTGEDKGSYKFGDKHPCVDGLFYHRWHTSGVEHWTTHQVLQKKKEKIRQWDAANNGPKGPRACIAKRYRSRNKRKIRQYHKKYVQENKEIYRASASERRAKKRESLVKLTDKQKLMIKHYYEHSSRLTSKMGIPFEVDHIIPLACGGLHHPSNLQVVPAKWNRKKVHFNTDRWLPNGF